LHDAVLKELRIDWSACVCVAEVLAFVDGLKLPAQHRHLRFSKIEEVIVPHRAPWGGSEQINSATEKDGVFLIEMQSGDVIRITAESVHFS